jgi:uncharacterized membrane protein YccC
LGKLGPDLSNEDLLKIKAAKERQREYAAQVSTIAREKASAASNASNSALNLAVHVAASQNHNHQNLFFYTHLHKIIALYYLFLKDIKREKSLQ